MKKRMLSLLLAVLLLLGAAPSALAASLEDYYFTDRDGTEMMAPARGFASQVVSFEPGSPWTKYEEQQNPENALGLPDRTGNDGTSKGDVCLGTGGVLVLGFDVALFDGEGLDLYVFEVGDMVEATKVEVSSDLDTWYEVGTAEGRTAGVDLQGKVPEGSRFRYVRLTDMKEYRSGYWPGADIDAVSGLNVKAVSSGWAEDEIQKAEDLGLVPDCLEGQDLTRSITRAEFAAVVVKTYEALSGAPALPAVNAPFTDCDDVEVLKAYNIGAVNGMSPTEFAPNSKLNREQAAVMLTRVFKRVTMVGWSLAEDSRFTLDYVKPSPFADDGDISGWAKDSVYFMAANKIINGKGNNKFVPKNITTAQEASGYANATREQALLIAVRMVENL